jgi:CubicO group peptidase (beta-lactamase class C family)
MVASESPVSNLNPAYGYQWWLGTFPTGETETYFAAGFGGQFIFVLPKQEMVVVFTAGGFEDGNYDALLQIVNDYILPAAGIAN